MLTTICLIAGVVLAVVGTVVFGFITGDWEWAMPLFAVALILCLLSSMAVGAIIGAIFNESAVEVLTVEAEITHLDITEAKGKYAPATVSYRVSVLGDDGFAAVFEVDPEVYAGLRVGDVISVEVTRTDNTLFDDTTAYSVVLN